MNRTVKTSMLVSFCWLFAAIFGMPAQGQSVGEFSVAEPTRLHAIASASGSKLIRSERVGEIESDDARATVLVIEVDSPEGERLRGIEIVLENSTATDQIYLTESLLSDVRNELVYLESSRQYDDECEAQYYCIRGVARCRPSQPVRQAYCPARYATPHSGEGLYLSTAHTSFMFPSVEPPQLTTLISAAIHSLE